MNQQQFYIEKDGIECVGVEGLPYEAILSFPVLEDEGIRFVNYRDIIKINPKTTYRIESINDPKTGDPLYLRRWLDGEDIEKFNGNVNNMPFYKIRSVKVNDSDIEVWLKA
jgi:hypothetical protein